MEFQIREWQKQTHENPHGISPLPQLCAAHTYINFIVVRGAHCQTCYLEHRVGFYHLLELLLCLANCSKIANDTSLNCIVRALKIGHPKLWLVDGRYFSIFAFYTKLAFRSHMLEKPRENIAKQNYSGKKIGQGCTRPHQGQKQNSYHCSAAEKRRKLIRSQEILSWLRWTICVCVGWGNKNRDHSMSAETSKSQIRNLFNAIKNVCLETHPTGPHKNVLAVPDYRSDSCRGDIEGPAFDTPAAAIAQLHASFRQKVMLYFTWSCSTDIFERCNTCPPAFWAIHDSCW